MDTHIPTTDTKAPQRELSERERNARKQREEDRLKSALRSNLRRRKKPQKQNDDR